MHILALKNESSCYAFSPIGSLLFFLLLGVENISHVLG